MEKHRAPRKRQKLNEIVRQWRHGKTDGRNRQRAVWRDRDIANHSVKH